MSIKWLRCAWCLKNYVYGLQTEDETFCSQKCRKEFERHTNQ